MAQESAALYDGVYTALDDVRSCFESIFSGVFENRLESDLQEAERVFRETAKTIYLQRPVDLKERDVAYLSLGGGLQRDITYVLYVDQFAAQGGKADFDTLAHAIPYWTSLGVTKLYLLPFLDSPMKDAGFDVKDYRNVRQDLGGIGAFERFAARARAAGLTIQMDIVFNHVSDEHEWARRLLEGDLSYKDYFIVSDDEPEILKREDNPQGTFITYKETICGRQRVVTRRLIFSGLESSHYRRVDVPVRDEDGAIIGSTPLWILHTFYRSQWDLNIGNLAVLREFMHVLGFWANRGVKTFRMDAVPFLVKTGESEPAAFAFVELMNRFLRLVAPSSNLLVEAAQKPEVIQQYFGVPTTFHHPLHERSFVTTGCAQLAYGFTAMPYMWASLLTGNAEYFHDGLRQAGEPPKGAAWNFFLRNHDELTLEMVDPQVGQKVFSSLSDKGYAFRNELGIGGRMASFLDMCPRRIQLAHAMLLSLQGEISLYAGDELAVGNDVVHMHQAARHRDGVVDTRDAGRGKICACLLQEALQDEGDSKHWATFRGVKRLIEVLQARRSLEEGALRILEVDHSNVLGFERFYDSEQTIVVMNLSDRSVTASIKLPTIGVHGWQDLITDEDIPVRCASGAIGINLDAYQAIWMTPK